MLESLIVRQGKCFLMNKYKSIKRILMLIEENQIKTFHELAIFLSDNDFELFKILVDNPDFFTAVYDL